MVSFSYNRFHYLQTKQFEDELKQNQELIAELQEKCAQLEEAVQKERNDSLALQKKLREFQDEQKWDDTEREQEVVELRKCVEALRHEVDRLKEELEREKVALAEMSSSKNNLQTEFQSTTEQLQKQRLLSSEIEQENAMLKDRLQGVVKEKNRAEEEKETSVMNESQEKFRLREAEKKIEFLKQHLDKKVRIQVELIEQKKEVELKLKDTEGELNALKEAKTFLDKRNTELQRVNAEVKKVVEDTEANHKSFERKEREYVEKLENEENVTNQLRIVNCELEYEAAELKERLEALEKSKDEAQAKYGQANATLVKLENDVSELRDRIHQLENENSSLQLRLKNNEAKRGSGEAATLQDRVKELQGQIEAEKERADDKEKEANTMLDQHHSLIQRFKAQDRENKTLKDRLEFVNAKLRAQKKVNKQQEQASPENRHPLIPELQKSPEPTAPTAGAFTPLARSLSNMGIRTQTHQDSKGCDSETVAQKINVREAHRPPTSVAGTAFEFKEPGANPGHGQRSLRSLQKPSEPEASAINKRSGEKGKDSIISLVKMLLFLQNT